MHQPTNAGEGILAIKAPWPSMMRTVYGDHARFEQTYFSAFKGYYFTGGVVVWGGAIEHVLGVDACKPPVSLVSNTTHTLPRRASSHTTPTPRPTTR
jgi:hypothetical protein